MASDKEHTRHRILFALKKKLKKEETPLLKWFVVLLMHAAWYAKIGTRDFTREL